MTSAQNAVFLYVTSLFTNLPTDRTFDVIIVIEPAFSYLSIPSPVLTEDDLKNLLFICCKETPSNSLKSCFIQVDGVSLGLTFAGFYMLHVQNLILIQNRVSNPHIFMRYLDDIFCVFNSNRHINSFKKDCKITVSWNIPQKKCKTNPSISSLRNSSG